MRSESSQRAWGEDRAVVIVDDEGWPADDVAEASERAGAHCVRMRGGDGLGVLRELGDGVAVCAWLEGEDCPSRAMDGVRASGFRGPIVAVVDRGREASTLAARMAGADEVLVRPVRARDVRSVLSRWARSE